MKISNSSYFETLNSLGGDKGKYFNGTYDMYFGINVNNSCAQVAAGMLLQYYDRLGIYDLVDDGLGLTTTMNKAYRDDEWGNVAQTKKYRTLFDGGDFDYHTTAEALHQILRFCTWPEQGAPVPWTLPDKMCEGLNTYFTLAGKTFVSASWTNNAIHRTVRGYIDANQPALLTTAINTVVYIPANSSNYTTDDGSSHTMVAYGYTYDIFNNTDEYICHTGWYDGATTRRSKVYVNANFPGTFHGTIKLNF